MYAYNKNTGKPILGTYEMIPGRAEIKDGSFKLNEDGTDLEYEHAGETEVFWDGQITQSDDGLEGRTIFLDEDGNELTIDDIELSNEERP